MTFECIECSRVFSLVHLPYSRGAGHVAQIIFKSLTHLEHLCRTLACDSLELLHDALPTSVPRVLLTEEIWGSLIGMFEINNLDLCVPSPIERFFTAVDGMPEDGRLDVTAVTQPLRDALGSANSIELEVCT
jgi:hypothetical protein